MEAIDIFKCIQLKQETHRGSIKMSLLISTTKSVTSSFYVHFFQY